MKEVIDVIAVILFVFILFIIIAGFNRQMVEKNKERKEKALQREADRIADLDKTKKSSKNKTSKGEK